MAYGETGVVDGVWYRIWRDGDVCRLLDELENEALSD